MPVTPTTLTVARQVDDAVNRIVDARIRTLVAAWAATWDTLAAELDRAVSDLAALREDGRWPSPWQIRRAATAQRALQAADGYLRLLARQAGAGITADIARVLDTAVEGQRSIVATQLPADAGVAIALGTAFDRVSDTALEAIVRRVTQQIESSLRPLAPDAVAAMRRALVRGVALGENPRVAARQMLLGLERAFNGGLNRALTIATTELLDAFREAAFRQHLAMRDTLVGWMWLSELSSRTCPSCWSRHGSIHPLEEPGPQDHPRGRCTRMPVTRSWADLGFDLDEPPSIVPDAEDVFRTLSPAEQRRVMGPGRLDALNSGRVEWGDLSRLRSNAGWRDSWQTTPLADLDLIDA